MNNLENIKSKMISDDKIFNLADFFKVFGDSTRIKIIYTLLESDLCVGEIAAITFSTPSAISHQLSVLKQNKLVKYRKMGKEIYYSLADDHIKQILEKGSEYLNEI